MINFSSTTIACALLCIFFLNSCQNGSKPETAHENPREKKPADSVPVQKQSDPALSHPLDTSHAPLKKQKDKKIAGNIGDTITSSNTEILKEEPEKAAPGKAEVSQGMELVASSDCLTCHRLGEKFVGPSYSDVAKKYPDDDGTVAMLANKIINGGAGNWGQIPMTPHPNMPVSDAKKMITYILSLQ